LRSAKGLISNLYLISDALPQHCARLDEFEGAYRFYELMMRLWVERRLVMED